MREKITWMRLLMISLLAAALILGGCGSDGKDGLAGVDGGDGTDGIDGTDGAPGAPGAPGQNLTIKALEVHDQGSSRAASWNVTGVTTTASTVVIAATIDDKGNNLTNVVNVRAIWDNAGVITSTNNAGTAVAVNNGNGSYSITITPAESVTAWTESADVAWRVRLSSEATYPEASLFAYQNDGKDVVAAATTVTNQSCLNCHGNQIFVDASGGFMSNAVDADGEQLPMVDRRNYHFSSYGVESCVMCHGNVAGAHGDRLMIYAHGIHNSNNFEGNAGSTAAVKSDWNFSVRYPAFMADCAACHNTEEGLSAVLDAPVTYNNCISCHGGVIRGETVTSDAQKAQAWRGFSSALPDGHLEFTGVTNCASCHSDDGYISSTNHSTIPLAENCAVCHFQGLPPAYSTEAHATFTQTLTCGSCHSAPEGGIGQTVADFHSGYTNRGLAQKIADDYFFIAIEGVEPTETLGQYVMTWSAINSATGSAYNVCGTTAVNGLGNVTFAPIVRLAYFEPNGDDITNPIGNVAGQPDGTIAGSTSCVTGVPITTFNVPEGLDEIEVTRALALLKPQAAFTDTINDSPLMGRITNPATDPQFNMYRVRIPAASYAFDLDDGAFSPRRAIVDSNKCLDCHGSNLYNHGATGGRYDNVDSCIACHNSGATDQYRRAGVFELDASGTYDGKDAETFSFAYNMHAIHSAGATDAYYVVYRGGRGAVGGFIYGYGGKNTLPIGWPVDPETGKALPYQSGITHGEATNVTAYLTKVNYPRPIADCTACHFEGTYDVPNQGKMVAVSLDSGAILADQNDDLLLGPASAACMSCHNSNDPFVQQALYTHADINGFAPREFDNGKQDVLDFVRTESCIICH